MACTKKPCPKLQKAIIMSIFHEITYQSSVFFFFFFFFCFFFVFVFLLFFFFSKGHNSESYKYAEQANKKENTNRLFFMGNPYINFQKPSMQGS